MKFKILSFLVFISFIACNTNIIEETVESYPDGSPKIVRYYKDDGQTRILIKETLYYPNHQKYMEGKFKNGKRDGKWVSWYQNGNKWSVGYFDEGVDHGKRIVYHENGKKSYQGYYTEGKKTGTWKFWDKNGKLVKTEKFD